MVIGDGKGGFYKVIDFDALKKAATIVDFNPIYRETYFSKIITFTLEDLCTMDILEKISGDEFTIEQKDEILDSLNELEKIIGVDNAQQIRNEVDNLFREAKL